ncbi:MAG: hypothetical protein SWY16_14165 [Cyanobacteriota bacterium]|nr:hypothetical protein [Cyanobacteriota bacterium]
MTIDYSLRSMTDRDRFPILFDTISVMRSPLRDPDKGFLPNVSPWQRGAVE